MSTVNMEAMMAELKAREVLAQMRLERIEDLQEEIRNRQEIIHAYTIVLNESPSSMKDWLAYKIKRLEDEADDRQRRLDALLAETLGDSPKNGEPRGEQGNWCEGGSHD